MAKAVLLLSGGLDSTLAGRLLLDQNVEVEAVNFVSPFCCCTPRSWGCSVARRAAEQLGIPVQVFGCAQDYLEVMKRPRFGRGRGMNACLDCRIYMFGRARAYLDECGADFVATGEVLGERPMSQRREAMALIERESGLEGLIVRPLCARHLPPSLPEQRGLVDRERLLALQGRCRRPQMALARTVGLTEYPCPAGGCLLTDAEFAARFRDLLEHEPNFGLAEAKLLRYGRHFRLPGGAKVVVGRDQAENEVIEGATRPDDVLLVPKTVPGPSALCQRATDEQDIRRAASIVASYVKRATEVDIRVRRFDGDGIRADVLEHVAPLSQALIGLWRVGVRPPQGARHGVGPLRSRAAGADQTEDTPLRLHPCAGPDARKEADS